MRDVRLAQPTTADQQTSFVGDEHRVRQILVNLLSNAIKFTEPGGQVSVSHGVADAALPAISGQSGPWTYIRVADTGVGIAHADLERVFLPFEQAKQGYTQRRGGTGLGLAISQELARLMGGDLVAESELGHGSTFTLWLPHHPSRADSAHMRRSTSLR
jgi:signal transduction histidine kinase